VSLTPLNDDVVHLELDALRAIAARVIDEHVNDHGTCRACGGMFPCLEACLAEHNLVACDCLPADRSNGDGIAQVARADPVAGQE
jgi:hypothetical protein